MKQKILLLSLCLTIPTLILAQIDPAKLTGTWIKIAGKYNSGEDLDLVHPFNQPYYRIEFKSNGKASKSLSVPDNGHAFNYSVREGDLRIGYVHYQIEYLTNDTLILLEEGVNGFGGTAIRYTFIPEIAYQNDLPLTPDMITLSGNDTVYVENAKIRARFNTDESFTNYLLRNVPGLSGSVKEDAFFRASFVLDSKGRIDSIKIRNGISKKIDRQFIKAITGSEAYWKPAKLGTKSVAVLRTVSFDRLTSESFEKIYFNYKEGQQAMQDGKYLEAIDFFNRCLEVNPEGEDALYQRGICNYNLNRPDKACEDWKMIRRLKSQRADNLIKELCSK